MNRFNEGGRMRKAFLFVLLVVLVSMVFVGNGFAQVDEGEKNMEEKAEEYLEESEQIFEDYHKTTKREEIEEKGAKVNKFIAGLKKLSMPLQRILVKKALWDAKKICETTDYVETAGYLGAAQWAIISALDEAAEPELIKGCINKNNDEEFRYLCMSLLGSMKSKDAVEPLIKIMLDKDDKLRREACIELGWKGNIKAVTPMIELYWKGEIRQNVVRGLGIIGDKRAFDVLMDGLKNGNPALKFTCIRAFEKLKDKRAVPILIEMLKPEEEIRVHGPRNIQPYIAIALGEIGDERAIPALTKMLKHKDWFHRAEAEEALGKIKDKSALDALIPLAEKGELDAIVAIGKIGGDEAVKVLERLKIKFKSIPDPYFQKCFKEALKEAKEKK
jgi:HEAT repeat protein